MPIWTSEWSSLSIATAQTLIRSAYDFGMTDNAEMLQQFLGAVAVFAADDATLEVYESKGKVSKKDVKGNASLLKHAKLIFEKRLQHYPFDFEQDKAEIQSISSLPHRQACALIVRHGEMGILRSLIEDMARQVEATAASAGSSRKDKSRRTTDDKPATKRVKR